MVQFSSSAGTFGIATFINRHLLAFFPGVKRFKAIRAEIFDLITKAFMQLKVIVANFAFKLGSFFTVVEIEVFMGCGATGAFDMLGRLIFRVSRIDWFQRFSVPCFIVVQNYSVIELSNWLYDPGSLNRRDWIDAEIPVVRMFIPKVIFT